MQITTITTWLTENYGIILLALVISLILFNKQIKSFFKSKKEKKIGYKAEVSEYGMDLSESLFNLENSLFSELQPRDPLSSMKGQREEAEKKLLTELQLKRNKMLNNKKQLGMRYTIWMNQLKSLDDMIAAQARMEEEFKRMEEINGKQGIIREGMFDES